MNHEPLKPAPNWVHTSGTGAHDNTGAVTISTIASPESFVHGFEQGAYALAEVLYPLVAFGSLDRAKQEEAFRILRAYHDGLARPVKDWKHQPLRK